MEKPLLCPIICFAPVVGDNSEEGEDVSKRGTHPLDPPPSPIILSPGMACGMDRDEQRVSVPGRLQSMGLQRVRLSDFTFTFTHKIKSGIS